MDHAEVTPEVHLPSATVEHGRESCVVVSPSQLKPLIQREDKGALVPLGPSGGSTSLRRLEDRDSRRTSILVLDGGMVPGRQFTLCTAVRAQERVDTARQEPSTLPGALEDSGEARSPFTA